MKDIKGYEGLYAITSDGKVWSYRKKRYLNLVLCGRGYLQAHLWKNGERKPGLVHRLVAETYIPNPSNLPQVNHKDEDKTNNNADNLEWCSAKYNMTYGSRQDENCIPVLCVETNTIYKSMTEAEHKLGVHQSGISQCCRGIYKTAGGFHWEYALEDRRIK